jgi:putative DNA primase/helicase
MLLRLAMLMALTDLQTRIDAHHIEAAMAWIRHATASVRFVFVSAVEEAKLAQALELANRVLAFLRERGQATRSQISAECFRGKVPKARIDASLEHLLASTPPKVTVQWGERADGAPGAPLRVYRLATE